MRQRDEAKLVVVKSGSLVHRLKYCTLRNQVTKTSKQKKTEYYKQRIDSIKHDGIKLWNTFNEVMGSEKNGRASFVESDGVFLTKPQDIINYFNNLFFIFFINKVKNLRQGLGGTGSNSCKMIRNETMDGKNCQFQFSCVEARDVLILLKTLPEYGSARIDNVDSKVLNIAADLISGLLSHIFNSCLPSRVFPRLWKEGQVIPLPKDSKLPFSRPNSRPISILPALSKIMERITHAHIQHYFYNNCLITKYQHAYRKGHSTCTAPLQMTDAQSNS